ncbi:T9SS type A sorting domain-containing protein [Flavobacterium sp.]|uniref:T9SS type A sorting domain-containing protein n=1 Tax=Flavobacterium sp. TaxID=239 RepID=UPI00260915F1|nr:T9SS type A sorting domain-containing protein [Flavobacterium sp.]
MRKLLFITTIFISFLSYAQVPKITFEYDAAGNQVQRYVCPTCSAKLNQDVKEISELQEEDLQKFFPEDVISYYPNPVKEELYLKWELINDNKVSSIEVFDMNGKVVQNYKDQKQENNQVISFKEFPVGLYVINLNYTNGEIKTIKILKN